MLLCASCRRHVKTSPCPFCGAQGTARTLGSPSNAGRLSRAQLVAGAALVGMVGCTGDDDLGGSEFGDASVDASSSSGYSTSGTPIYGCPAAEGCASGGNGASSGAIYGGPPDEDGGSSSSSSGDVDGGLDDGGLGDGGSDDAGT